MSIKYEDDKMEHIENDIEKIQQKTGMYISYVGERGANHLGVETLQNAIDEASNKKSPCKLIQVTVDIKEDSLTVEDDGRGIPEDDVPMEIICTKLNAGSKFTREQSGKSSGENGVGMTATNALSSLFEISSIRDGKYHTLIFEEGTKKSDTKGKAHKEHGCIVKFIPSKKYLGKKAKINPDLIEAWISTMAHFIPKHLKIEYSVVDGLTKIRKEKYKAKTLIDLLKSHVTDNKLSDMYSLSGDTKLVEDFRGERKIKRELSVEVAFGYSDTIEPWVDSFCNYINTYSGGVHLNAAREAVWRFFTKKTNESLTEREKEKYKILKVDVEYGLNLVINIFTDMQPQLVGQTKSELSNLDLYDPIKELVGAQLEVLFSNKKDELAKVTKLIKSNCKARLEANKTRNATIKDSYNRFDNYKLDNFTPCNNKGKQYKEIILCEGKSAGDCLVDGRDPDTQAVLSFRGVPANIFKRDMSTILDNKEWYEYVKLLKTNFGPKFDMSKLYYDKIIIATDSDVDGLNITSGIGCFHAVALPQLIVEGKLYKAVGPLYRLADKDNEFVRSKKEYVDLYINKITKTHEVVLKDKKVTLSKNELKDFIYEIEEYLDTLSRVARHFSVKSINIYLIEALIAYFVMNDLTHSIDSFIKTDKGKKNLLIYLQERFPEITITDNGRIKGIIDGKFQSLKINNRLSKKMDELEDIIKKYGYNIIVSIKNGSKEEMTIGKFAESISKYKPKILNRFKGLGEANSRQLWDTTLNPDTRMLIKYTMEDAARDLAIFATLHGTSKKDLAARKDMMRSYKIRREYIDN